MLRLDALKLKRFLLVYSALVIAMGLFFATSLIKEDRKAEAALTFGNGVYTNLCGTGTSATAYSCPGSCNPGAGNCSGPWVVRYTCQGRHAECTSNEESGVGQLGAGCGVTQQVDVFSRNCRDGAGNWICQPSDLLGYMVWYSGDCQQQNACPHTNTQAIVRRGGNDPWVNNLNLTCGESFMVGSAHNGTGNYAGDTDIQIVGPGVNTIVENSAMITTGAAGAYQVIVRTSNGQGGYYGEAQCNATATVVCNPPAGGFEIEKVATNDNGPYDIGEHIQFRVSIRNTGGAPLTTVPFRDVFDHRYLRFLAATVNGQNVTNSFGQAQSGNTTTLSNADITALTGDIPAGASINIIFTFRALQPIGDTCNDVFARPQGLPEKQARDCVDIIISTDL